MSATTTTIDTEKALRNIVEKCKKDKNFQITLVMCAPLVYIRMKGSLHFVGSVPSFMLDASCNSDPSLTDQITFHSKAVLTVHGDVIYLR
jgi:hypothetical protein